MRSQLGLVLLDWHVVRAADLRVADIKDNDERQVLVAYYQLPPYTTLRGQAHVTIELIVAPWSKPRRGFGWALYGGRGLAEGCGRMPFRMWFRSSSEAKGQMTADQAREAATAELMHVVECHQRNMERACT